MAHDPVFPKCSVEFTHVHYHNKHGAENGWKFRAVDGNRVRETDVKYDSLEQAFKEAQDYFGRNKENDVEDD